MLSFIRLILVSVVFLSTATNLAARSEAVNDGGYTTNDLEFYLTDEEIFFIRPGLVIEILDVTIPPDMQPEVTYTISDPRGMPLDHEGITTPGVVDMRFTLANIPMGEEQKVRLTYERISRNGVLTMLAPGEYHYKFDVVIESDQGTTHTLVLGGRRDLREFDLDRYADNDVESWVPSGDSDAVPRDIVTTETCNRCHQALGEHGSRWQSPQACTQCHNPTQNTRFDILIHAVHSAGEAGGHDFSEIEYPADINDCQVCHTGGTPTESFPMVASPAAALVCDGSGNGETTLNWQHTGQVEIQIRTSASPDGKVFARGGSTGSAPTGKWVKDGTMFDLYDLDSMELIQSVKVDATVLGCVSNAPGKSVGVAGAQHTNWMDHPTRVVCGSCHEHADVDFETGEGHIALSDDSKCGNCHEPDSGKEFDRSVAGAHLPLYKSAQLPGVIVEFMEVTNTNPGDAPIVTYSVKSKNGPLNPAALDRLRFVITGPNEDYSFYAREDVGSGSVQVGDDWVYTFNTPLPMDAVGSFTIGLEGRDEVPVDFGGGEVSDERDVAEPPSLAFAVTDATAIPRRMVVDDEKCESCHVNLDAHGGGRRDANYCITCHSPDLVDIATPSESVHMKWMIHKIHRGERLENGYVVVRNRGTFDFSDKVYPGDLRKCDACHVNDSQQLSLPDGVLPTITEQAWWSPTLPQAAACLSCHDDDESAVHAYSNTTFFGESCSTCHGEGKFASVDRVHAQ
jgi:hypothetical protein